jgi:hypothetical protein
VAGRSTAAWFLFACRPVPRWSSVAWLGNGPAPRQGVGPLSRVCHGPAVGLRAGYWDRAGRGGLDQLRASRRQALAPIYATPGPGDRFHVTERDLVVHGSLATYHIDLATASVRMEPAGKWLSFDTRQAAPASATDLFPWMPVTDDHEVLSRITLRATILANDDQLASRQLLRQIRHR